MVKPAAIPLFFEIGHMDPDTGPALSRNDAYALARAMVGLSWSHAAVSPVVGALLTQLDLNTAVDMQLLRRVLSPDLLRQVLSENPDAALPDRRDDLNTVPTLPASAHLSAIQEQEAVSVGQWLDDHMAWAGAAANETPLL